MIEVRRVRPKGRLAWTAGSVLAIAGVLAAVACQQILSIDGTVTNCKLPVPQGSCQACVAASCCAQASVCADDPGCAAYETCLLACGSDYECRANCVEKGLATSDNVPMMDQCVVANCETACGMSCGAAGSYAEPDAAQDCQQCIIDHGCATGEACGTSLDCEQLGHCAAGCATDDCEAACAAAHPDASPAFYAVAYGLGVACLNRCSVGNEWGCVNNITYPLAKSPNITLTFTITDHDLPNGVPGLTVKACDVIDRDCTNPRVTAPTDSQGNAVLAFPTLGVHGIGFQGYFEIKGPGIPDSLFFLTFPLSEEHASLTTGILSQTAYDSLWAAVNVPGPDGGAVAFSPDPSLGTLVAFAGDCHHQGAPNATLTMVVGAGSQMVERYVQGLVLSNEATTTDHSGLAFFFNVPPAAALTVQATPLNLGRVSSTVSVFVRPKTISYVRANPGQQ